MLKAARIFVIVLTVIIVCSCIAFSVGIFIVLYLDAYDASDKIGALVLILLALLFARLAIPCLNPPRSEYVLVLQKNRESIRKCERKKMPIQLYVS